MSDGSVAIIGGGIIGTSIAWRLVRDGWQVSIFEQNTVGGEASWAGAGMLAPGGEISAASVLATLALESRRLYSAFVDELRSASGLDIDYQECGALDLAYTDQEALALNQRAEAQQGIAIPSKSVREQHVAAFWPRIRMKGLVAARFYPEDAIVDPRHVTRALHQALKQADVRIEEHCAVTGVCRAGSGISLTAANRSESFDYAVLAAGAWSSSVDIGGLTPLPLTEPVKGHLIGYRQPLLTCNTIVRHGHTYLLQRENGFLVAGASAERVGFDRTVSGAIAEQLAAQASSIMPHLGEAKPSEVWVGFRPGAENLHIGRWDASPLFLAYGHYRNGILLAPATADRIALEINASSGKT